MSLHVSAQEAHNCLAYLERAMQLWEAEQIHARQLIATQSRAPGRGPLKKSRKQRKREPKIRKHLGRQWTPEQLAMLTHAVRTNAKVVSLVPYFPGIPYSSIWYKVAELTHSSKLSHRRGATVFSWPPASAPATVSA